MFSKKLKGAMYLCTRNILCELDWTGVGELVKNGALGSHSHSCEVQRSSDPFSTVLPIATNSIPRPNTLRNTLLSFYHKHTPSFSLRAFISFYSLITTVPERAFPLPLHFPTSVLSRVQHTHSKLRVPEPNNKQCHHATPAARDSKDMKDYLL